MRFSLTAIAGGALLLCGCSVMHFKNGPVEPGRPVEKWHHNVAFSLYETSAPLDMKTVCENRKWSMVTTKETFVTGLAGNLVNSLLYGGLGNPIWDPQMVEYACEK